MTAEREPTVGESHDDVLGVPRDADQDRDVDDEPDNRLKDEPWRTPYESGAVPISEPVLPPAPPRRRPVDWLPIAVPLAVALVSIAVVTVAYGGRWGLRGTVIIVGCLLGWVSLLAEVRREGRHSEMRVANIGILVLGAVASPGLAFWYGFTSTVLGLLAFGAIATAWRAISRIRASDQRAETDRVRLAAAYDGAVAWNRIREALRAPGARVEQSFGPPNFDEPLRVRTEDPVTRETALRDLEAPLPRGGWVVVDDTGSVMCAAPPGALEGWLATWPEGSAAR